MEGQQEQVAQGCVWSGFVYCQGWRPPQPSGQGVPMFDHTHNKKEFFILFELYIPCFDLSLALSIHISKKSLTLHTIPSCICTCWCDPPEPSVIQSKQLFQPFCECQMLQPLHCTLLVSLQYVCILLVLDTAARCLTSAEQRWRITYLNLLAMLLKSEGCFKIS